jgi:hypothetical protein
MFPSNKDWEDLIGILCLITILTYHNFEWCMWWNLFSSKTSWTSTNSTPVTLSSRYMKLSCIPPHANQFQIFSKGTLRWQDTMKCGPCFSWLPFLWKNNGKSSHTWVYSFWSSMPYMHKTHGTWEIKIISSYALQTSLHLGFNSEHVNKLQYNPIIRL